MVTNLKADTFTHSTHWKIEKYKGGIDEFVIDRMIEAIDVLNGHKGYSDFTNANASILFEKREEVLEWKATISPSEQKLWTPNRVTSEAIKKMFYISNKPYEIDERDGNLLVTVGITAMIGLTFGTTIPTAFSNANAYLGVGDSSTASAVGQTDLQAATNKLRVAMNSSYPSAASPAVSLQSTYGSSDANFAWNEIGTFNASTAGTMLNRVVQTLGTKSSGATWTLTETITFS